MRSAREQYVTEWATKAHRNPSDVYVPESLQPDLCVSCGWIRKPIPLLRELSRVTDGPGNHTGCKEGRW